MPQGVRAILFSVALAVVLTIVAYYGLPMTTVLMFPGFWLAIRAHIPNIYGIHSMIIASIIVYTVSTWLVLQLVHILFSTSRRARRAWLRSRL